MGRINLAAGKERAEPITGLEGALMVTLGNGREECGSFEM